jgi:hypothetical protein
VAFSPSPLLAGDSSDNNVVNLVDFSMLATAFGAVTGDPLYNAACDYNGSGGVDLADFSLLVSNFGSSGAPPISPTPAPALTAESRGFKLVYDGNPRPGEDLKVMVVADDVSDLYGYTFELSFDPTVLALNGSITEGDLLTSGGQTLFATVASPGSDASSVASVISSLRNGSAVKGTGTIAIASFKVLAGQSHAGTVVATDALALRHIEKVDSNGYLVRLPDYQVSLSTVPMKSRLLANYPNPFNPETWIPFELAKSSDVTIQIYDVAGRLVRTIDLGQRPAGHYLNRIDAAYWDGRNNSNERVASGIYIYRLTTGDFSAMRRMVIIK